MDYTIQPLEINERSELDDFDQAEAREAGWPSELIADALAEIWRRELMPNEPIDWGNDN